MNICINKAIKNRAANRRGRAFGKTIATMRQKAAKVLKDGVFRRAEMLAKFAKANTMAIKRKTKRVYKPRVKTDMAKE